MVRPRRKKAREHKVDRDCLKGRLFEDFVGLLGSDPDAMVNCKYAEVHL